MKIIHNYFDPSGVEQVGTKFLLGNGRLGYRGTLEEMEAGDKVALTLAGAYDQYRSYWREPINAPNPFYVLVNVDGKNMDIRQQFPLNHAQTLDCFDATFSRTSEYEDVIIESLRFVDRNEREALSMIYTIKAKKDVEIDLFTGIDVNTWDLNGPHLYFQKIENGLNIFCLAETNEKKYLAISVDLQSDDISFVPLIKKALIGKSAKFTLKAAQEVSFISQAVVTFGDSRDEVSQENKLRLANYLKVSFNERLYEHKLTWHQDWSNAYFKIDGDERANRALTYSIYHLLILAPRDERTSIAARGLSGQTYKGAVFWDTEIFLLPFFTLVEPKIARDLVLFRVEGLPGALAKAKEFGYKGAFYAWESQENGKEACSLYNISDAETGEPVRTYFADRQIHISADVAYGALMYLKRTGDESILNQPFFEMLKEICFFYQSYAVLGEDDKYHFNGVIGPDEYHELIDDNAFTNYMIHATMRESIKLFKEKGNGFISLQIIDHLELFSDQIYLPTPNDEGIIEQFKGYFDLEDILPDQLHTRKKTANEYLGGPKGIATPTRVIKQADVVTLMVLLPEYFTEETKKANYEFYEPYTEHGSSLSACMYAILGLRVGKGKQAYQDFLKSAEVDLNMQSKRYAGGTYIGGSHPASAGGAYLSALLGFAGMQFGAEITLKPQFVGDIQGMSFKYYEKGNQYKVDIDKNNEIQRRLIK